MIKSLVLLTTSLVSLSTPVASSVITNDGVQLNYKYETNEVNSANDLVVGNIYKYNLDFSHLSGGAFLRCSAFYSDYIQIETENKLIFYKSSSNGNIECYESPYKDVARINSASSIGDVYVVYDSLYGQDVYTNYSISDFNILVSAERVYPDNIFGNVYDFIDSQIINGIPNIDNVQFTIGNHDMTLRSWLTTSVCIVLALLLISFLVLFIRWLFRIFAGLIHR